MSLEEIFLSALIFPDNSYFQLHKALNSLKTSKNNIRYQSSSENPCFLSNHIAWAYFEKLFSLKSYNRRLSRILAKDNSNEKKS